jgi:agmatinase
MGLHEKLVRGGPAVPQTFAALPPEFSDWERARVALLPVPYDGTASYVPGARRGPQAILEASPQLELYDTELQVEPYRVGITTLPPLDVVIDPEAMLTRVEHAVSEIIQGEKFPVVLGGDHSVTVGIVRALKGRYSSLSVLQLDAHADLREEYQGSRFSHACVARRLVELGCPVVQLGIRSLTREEAQWLRESEAMAVTTAYAQELAQDFTRAFQALDELSSPVYITLDVDVFDPSVMPATGTPEPGGLSWYDVLRVLRGTFERFEVIGCDLVELAPIGGLVAPDFLAARLVYKLIGYWATSRKLLAELR